MKQKIYLDLDDTYLETEKYIRHIMKQNGIKLQNPSVSLYSLNYPEKYREVIDMVFSEEGYSCIPKKEGAEECLKLLETEYDIVFCSSYITKAEAKAKQEFASMEGKPLILCCLGDGWNKSKVLMSDGILIDDNLEVLSNSNALKKIRMYCPYEKVGEQGLRESFKVDKIVTNFYEVVDYLMGVEVDEELRRCFCERAKEFHYNGL